MTATRSVAVRTLDDAAVSEIQGLADRYCLTAIKDFHPLKRAVMIATGIKELRAAVQPLMPDLMLLKGSALGFMSDEAGRKGKDGSRFEYGAEIVRDAFVESLLRGLRPTNQEWGIIQNRCYTCLNGYQRLVEEYEGLTDLRTASSPPFTQGGHCCVMCSASWKLHGVENQLRDHRGKASVVYAVTAYESTGIDARISKARRRMYRDIYRLLSGTIFTEPDVGEETPELPAPEGADKTRTQEVIEQVRARNNGGQSVAAPGGPGPAASSLLSDAQKAEIAKLRHVVSDEELQLMVEQHGVFEVNQLTTGSAAMIIGVLSAAQGNRE